MIKIRFYLDIAGGKKDAPTLAACGYLATEERWREAGKVWGRILESAKADEFHATDFYACRKKFKHLERGSPEHALLEIRFLRAAQKYTKMGFGFGFDVRTYYETMAAALAQTRFPYESMGKAKSHFGVGLDPRVYALSYALNRAAQKALPRGTQTAVFFEQEAGIGAAIDYVLWLKRRGEGWTGAYTSFTPVTKAERPAQMADLLAYHSCARIRDFMKDPTAEPRAPMKVLLKVSRFSGNVTRGVAV